MSARCCGHRSPARLISNARFRAAAGASSASCDSRLARKGAVAYHHHTGPEAVALATEAFLALEARGWKGRRGSAVGCDERLAAFTRAAMAGLSAEGLAAVTSLTLDGEPVSMGVVLRSGGTAYTWKIAYEEAAAAFSPGYLLALEDLSLIHI